MNSSDYVVVGASHAGLAAIDAIQIADPDARIILLSRENRPPYSPTVLPHVMSGRVSLEDVPLRSRESLEQSNVTLRAGVEVVSVDPMAKQVRLASGESIAYGKLLLATGAAPTVPAIPGLEEGTFHVLRTAEDAERLRDSARHGGGAVIVGGGLIGLHAAETLLQRNMTVTVVEALPRVLTGAFGVEVAKRIAGVFEKQGIRILTGTTVESAETSGDQIQLRLSSGREEYADLVLVAVGVRPRLEILAGSGIETDQGILVEDHMRTGTEGVWAAGDVAQASDFFGRGRRLLPTLTDAVEQGRIAGRDMAGDPEASIYAGGIPRNAFSFFDHGAFSVGLSYEKNGEVHEDVECQPEDDGVSYQALLFRENRLVGATGIDSDLDPGVLAELVRRREDLSGIREALATRGRDASRLLMSDRWR